VCAFFEGFFSDWQKQFPEEKQGLEKSKNGHENKVKKVEEKKMKKK
jgi:hypothetical protein